MLPECYSCPRTSSIRSIRSTMLYPLNNIFKFVEPPISLSSEVIFAIFSYHPYILHDMLASHVTKSLRFLPGLLWPGDSEVFRIHNIVWSPFVLVDDWKEIVLNHTCPLECLHRRRRGQKNSRSFKSSQINYLSDHLLR